MDSIRYLNELEDVHVPAPVDGDVLYWDAAASLWKAKAVAAGGGTQERLIRFSADDCDVRWTGAAWQLALINEYWTCGYWASNNYKKGGGGRFVNIYIPKDAIIQHAYFKVIARNSDVKVQVNTRLHGELAANPATFSNIANYNARARTVAVIDWDNIPSWTAGTEYQSPDIKDIVQEIVNLAGWVSGNPIVIFWDDHDGRSTAISETARRARSWEHSDPVPPMLYIEWTL